MAGLQRAVRTAEITKHLRNSSAAEPGAPGDSFRPAPSVIPSPGASRSGPQLERGPGARTSEPWAPRPSSGVPRAPLLSVLRSRFPQRPEAQDRARGGERAGMRGPVCGRVRGAGAVSPRGAEPGWSEAVSPAEGPLCRRGIPGSSASPARGGSEQFPGPGDRPALSSPTLLFLGRTRLPSSSGGQGPDLLRGRAPDPARPPCASPAPRARTPGAAGQTASLVGEIRPLEAPSDGDTGPPGLLAPPAAPSAARGPGDTKRGGFAVARGAQGGGGEPETTTWGQLHARRFFDPCLWCGRTQISRPGRKKGSL